MKTDEIEKLFDDMKRLEAKKRELDRAFEEIYEAFSKIAYDLHKAFLQKNLNDLRQGIGYYRIHFDKGFIVAEELVFEKAYENFLVFSYKNSLKGDIQINVPIDSTQKDYRSVGAVIDKEQFQKLSDTFEIVVR